MIYIYEEIKKDYKGWLCYNCKNSTPCIEACKDLHESCRKELEGKNEK